MLDRPTLAARVRAAISEAGKSQQDVASAIGIGESAMSRALNAQRDFKSLEIALLCEHLGLNPQTLLGDELTGDSTESLAARFQPNASPAINDALARVEEFLELDALLNDLGYAAYAELSLSMDQTRPAYEQGQLLADALRSKMGIGDDDLPAELDDLAQFLEARLGVDTAFERLPQGLDGLSVCRAGFKLALVSSGISATRQRYTLAHELGHLVADDAQDLRLDENVLGSKSPEETRANSFAAAFLMPAAALKAAITPGYASEELIAQLLGRYRVSLDALAFRLHNIGAVNAIGRDRIRSLSSSRIALRAGRTSDLQARNDLRMPGNLLNRAIEAYVKGDLSIRPIASVLRVDPNLLLDELTPGRPAKQDQTEDELVPNL
jgi:Zn-dependent peptidase ImmA (M78 family)